MFSCSRLTNLAQSFFYYLGYPDNRIKIIVDSVSRDNHIKGFHDEDDQCMKAVIDKFEMGDCFDSSGNEIGANQAVFTLKDIDNIELNLITAANINPEQNKDFILTKCAAQSILKLLYAKGLLEKDSYAFNYRPRGEYFGGYMASLDMTPAAAAREFRIGIDLENTIAQVCAYMGSNKICVIFGNISVEKQAQIKSVFSKTFQEVAPEERKAVAPEPTVFTCR